jgi:hypothetical protein
MSEDHYEADEYDHIGSRAVAEALLNADSMNELAFLVQRTSAKQTPHHRRVIGTSGQQPRGGCHRITLDGPGRSLYIILAQVVGDDVEVELRKRVSRGFTDVESEYEGTVTALTIIGDDND